jgi:hypothetical protein
MNALYSLYDALVSINVPGDKARAVVDAMERDMTTLLATKSDLASTQLLLKKDVDIFYTSLKNDINSLKQDGDSKYALLKKDIEAGLNSTIVRLGTVMVAVAGLLFTALKLT